MHRLALLLAALLAVPAAAQSPAPSVRSGDAGPFVAVGNPFAETLPYTDGERFGVVGYRFPSGVSLSLLGRTTSSTASGVDPIDAAYVSRLSVARRAGIGLGVDKALGRTRLGVHTSAVVSSETRTFTRFGAGEGTPPPGSFVGGDHRRDHAERLHLGASLTASHVLALRDRFRLVPELAVAVVAEPSRRTYDEVADSEATSGEENGYLTRYGVFGRLPVRVALTDEVGVTLQASAGVTPRTATLRRLTGRGGVVWIPEVTARVDF